MEFFTEINGIIESEQMLSGQIHRNTDLVIDQEYSPTSDNPLSGAAVHEAFTKEYITSGRLQGPPIGTGVTIEGNGNVATGNYSHAEGSGTVASGDNSHTEGSCTKAVGANQHAQGKYNELDTNSKYAHIVGNGTDDTHRSNAHTLDWDGNAWYAGKVSQAKEPTKKDDLATVNYVVEQSSHDEKVKGLLKEIATPATFVDSDGDAIRNVKVVGASVQNGTPTPTAPIAIQNTGNEVKVVSCGKNLFDKGIPRNNYIQSTGGYSYLQINFSKPTTITISFDKKYSAGEKSGYFYGLSDDTTDKWLYHNTNNALCNEKFSFVVNNNIKIYSTGDAYGWAKEVFMIEVSNDKTSYEPYNGNIYTIPLTDTNGTTHTMRQFDEVKKHDDGKWYFDCNSAVKEFDGTEAFGRWGTYNTYMYNIGSSITDGLCNRYIDVKTNDVGTLSNNTCTIRQNGYAYFRDDTCTDINAFKTKLAEWNTAGTPLTVLYQTATTTSYELSTETAQKLESIYSQKGICNIYFINNVIPSGSFEYVQALEESIADVGNEYFYKIAENSLTTPANITDSYGGKLINEVVTGKSEQTQIANTNLLPYPYSATTTTQNGITFTDNGNGTITVNGIATANITFRFISNNSTILNGIYTLSGCPIGGGYDSYYLQVTNHYDLGNNVSFTVTNTTIGDCFIIIKSGVTINNLVFKPQLQAGSTATDFVRPTSGMGLPSPNYPQDINNVGNSLSLVSCGKNLCDITSDNILSGYYSDSAGLPIDNNNYCRQIVDCLPNTQYTLSSNVLMYSLWYFNNNIVIQRKSVESANKTITTPNNCNKIRVSFRGSVENFSWCQMEYGEYNTSYEPYNGNTYTIPLTDINGTSHIMRQFDEVKKHSDGKWYFDCQSRYVECNGTESNWISYTSQNGFMFATTDIYSEADGPGFCNRYKRLVASTLSETGVRFGASNTSKNVYFFHVYTDSMTLDAWKQQVATWNTAGTPLAFLYKTKTITSYELSASTSAILDSIAIQKGNANIYFTNAVTPTMTTDYPLDLKLYTDNKMSALEARLTALENIQ